MRFIIWTSCGRSKPFIPVNCGGIPENLLEAELFGHERGAFTGALRLKHGLLEQANGGTLFLDEIGDMPLAMQVKLLRALQERTVTRLGSEQSVAVDFRLICATHRDLKKLVEQGTFREDLFYRVNVVHLRVPPLRERPEDSCGTRGGFCARSRSRMQDRRRSCPLGPRRRYSIIYGPATCANCAIASSVPMSSPPATRSTRR